MRALVLVALAGCFNPDPEPNQPCTDWCPPPESCVAGTCRADTGDGPNFAFVTSERRQLHLETPFSLDEWCRDLAREARMSGEYIAWISTTQAPVRMRLQALAARGWVRPDGKPFADTVDDVFAGTTHYPLRIADDGSDVGALDELVVTGTEANGNASTNTCGDFMSATPTTPVTIGKADAGQVSWTALGADDCGKGAHVYCFGISRSVAVEIAPLGVSQKRAFVTKNTYTKRPPTDADQICNTEVGGGTKYLALVATLNQSVEDRFTGTVGPWFRNDGVLLTEDMRTFAAPLEVSHDGSRIRGDVWFGAATLRERGSADRNCNDWTTGAMMRSGETTRSSGTAPFDRADGSCSGEYHYYCAER